MNKKLLSLLLVSSTITLAGCNKKGNLEINFEDETPMAYVGEVYDFRDVLVEEDGVDYTIKAYYQNYYEKKEYSLNITDGYCFTPVNTNEIVVVVTANKGNLKTERNKTLAVTQKGDPIDELVVSGGYSGWADTGITKELETNENYLRGENSKTSVAVHYQGNNRYVWGCSVFTLDNFRLLPHWTDKTWENAILTYYVYNPTDYDIEFQLRIKDFYTGLVDIDWGHALSISQVAKPKQWTQIFFSLKKMGVDHTLFVNEEGTRRDNFTIKAKWAGAPLEDGDLYDYQFYVDGIDVVPNTMYPDIDTKSYTSKETIEYGWENMKRDDGWTSSTVKFDGDVVRTSEYNSRSSMLLTFNEKNANDNGYAVVLNPQEEDSNNLPSFRHGVLNADIKFSDDITDKTVRLIAVNKEWDYIVRKNYTVTDLGDGWYRLNVDFGAHEEFDTVGEGIRIGFGFPGINDANKANAEVHIDNITFDQDDGTPAKLPPETIENGWENMPIDEGWSASNYVLSNDVYKANESTQSRSSLMITFNGKAPKADIGYSCVLAPQFISGRPLDDFSSGTFEFDLKFSNNIEDKSVGIKAVHKDWSHGTETLNGVDAGDGWYHYSIDLSTSANYSIVTELIRVAFTFNGVTSENQNTATIYLDNVILIK